MARAKKPPWKKPSNDPADHLREMEETNKTAQKALGAEKKGWMDIWMDSAVSLQETKRKRQVDDQTTPKSKVQRPAPLESDNGEQVALVSHKTVTGKRSVIQTQKRIRSLLVPSTGSDKSSRPTVAQKLNSLSTAAGLSSINLNAPIPAEKPLEDQLTLVTPPDPNLVGIPLDNQGQPNVESVNAAPPQTPKSTNSGTTVTGVIHQQPSLQPPPSLTNSNKPESSLSSAKCGTPVVVTKDVEDSINMPSLDQFVKASGDSEDMIWKYNLAYLQSRINNLDMARYNSYHKKYHLQWMSDLKEACIHREGYYLLMIQTSVIMEMPLAKGRITDGRLRLGLSYLQELFGNLDERCRSWFISFPCKHPSTRESHQQWVGHLSFLIRMIGVEMETLRRAYSLKRIPPRMDEIDTLLWDSVSLQTAVFRSLLTHYWPPPTDHCFNDIIEVFAEGLHNQREYRSTHPSTLHLKMRARERETVDANVRACYEAHKNHIVSNLGTIAGMPTIPVSSGNNFPHRQESASVSPPIQRRGISQSYRSPCSQPCVQLPTARLLQQSPEGHEIVTRAQSIPPWSANIREPIHQTAQSTLTPTSLVQIDWNDREIIASIMQAGNPNRPPDYRPLAFPPTLGIPRASNYGPPLHHAHLRDHVIQQTPENTNDMCRTFLVDFLAERPMEFTREQTIGQIGFDVLEETFMKLPRETFDTSGGLQRRIIKIPGLMVRLRGAAIKFNTISEWYIAETHWPSSISVLLNNKAIEFRRKPQYAKDLAVDVTSHIRKGHNQLSVTFLWQEAPPVDFHYSIGLELILVADINSIRAEIQSGLRSNTAEQLKNYFEPSPDSEVEMILEHLNIPLLDPFTSQMPNTPVRSVNCTHFQCFDLDVFLGSRPKDGNNSGEFICPVCRKDARPQMLRLDDWMAQVLQKLKDDNQHGAKTIRVLPDLTWVVKEEAQAEKTVPARSYVNSQGVEVIELD